MVLFRARTRHARLSLGAIGLVALVAGACSGGGATPTPGGSAATPSAGAVSPSAGTASPGGSVATPAPSSPGGAVQVVAVKLTDDGCPPVPATVAVGPVRFDVTNDNATASTEVELIQGERILGEKENLAPGLAGSFTLDLPAGAYEIACPGAATPRAAFTVSATATETTAPTGTSELNQATVEYAAYVRDQVGLLVAATRTFTDAVIAGDVAQAKSLYGPARVLYERIEPVAESFGDLDPKIDGRIDDAATPEEFTGFHRIERQLYETGNTAGMQPIAAQLLADVQQLETLVGPATYQPAQLANGAAELIDEIARSKITGEEERYSRIDLLDFQGNLDGAKVAYELLQPALQRTHADLAATVSARFVDVQTALDAYRSGDGFVSYDALKESDTRALAQKVGALAEPLSLVAAAVVGR